MKEQNMMSNLLWGLILVVLFAGIPGILSGCAKKKPILIGFVGQLTGRQAEVGVQERNGVQLAVEKINASGGVAGRKIELIVRDDFGTPEKAQAADRELIQAGVLAIIGHTSSVQTLEGLKVTNPAQVVLIGPTVSSPILSGLDDYFFRVYPSFKDNAEAFAQYIYQGCGINRMGIIYDSDNAAYAKTYRTTFADKFQSMGGEIACEVSYPSLKQPDFTPLLLKLRESKAEGLLISGYDIDTAYIAQSARVIGWPVPLFASAGGQTEALINYGGQAVEGLKLEQSNALTSQSPAFLDFQAGYQARFGQDPFFGAAFGYEAALVLAAALEKTGGKAEGLKDALIAIHDFPGLIDTFSFDRFGDVERPCYLSTVRDGKYVPLEKITLTKIGCK